jgi:hypothetical protein
VLATCAPCTATRATSPRAIGNDFATGLGRPAGPADPDPAVLRLGRPRLLHQQRRQPTARSRRRPSRPTASTTSGGGQRHRRQRTAARRQHLPAHRLRPACLAVHPRRPQRRRGRSRSMLGTCQYDWLTQGLAHPRPPGRSCSRRCPSIPTIKTWDAWGSVPTEREPRVLHPGQRHRQPAVPERRRALGRRGRTTARTRAGRRSRCRTRTCRTTWINTFCEMATTARSARSEPGLWTIGSLSSPTSMPLAVDLRRRPTGRGTLLMYPRRACTQAPARAGPAMCASTRPLHAHCHRDGLRRPAALRRAGGRHVRADGPFN